MIDPLGYLDFLSVFSGARLVLTDSGGIQEETTALGIPCLTLRENTERPITVELGTNVVVGTDTARIVAAAAAALTISSCKVSVDITHTYRGDLRVTLNTPDGRAICSDSGRSVTFTVRPPFRSDLWRQPFASPQ